MDIQEQFKRCVETHFETDHTIAYLRSRGMWCLRFLHLGYKPGWKFVGGPSGEQAKVYAPTLDEVLERSIEFIQSFAKCKDSGWVCPTCRTAYSPKVASCTCCLRGGNEA